MAVQIQLRRDTAANWTSTNPTLAQGEIGIELVTFKFKIGDGTTSWNALPYASSSSGVTSLNSLTGALNIVAGSGVTVTPSGSNITISATGGGGGGISSLNTLTGSSQTFTNDTNVQINSSGSTHALTWSGQLSIARGGTGASTAAAARNALMPSQTGNSGKFLTTDGTNMSWATVAGGSGVTSLNSLTGALNIVAGTNITVTPSGSNITISATGGGGGISSLNTLTGSSQTFANDTNVQINSSGSTHTLNWAGTLAISRGGTGASTANAAFNALVPSQGGNSGKFLTTDGTNTSWATVVGGGSWQMYYNTYTITGISGAVGVLSGFASSQGALNAVTVTASSNVITIGNVGAGVVLNNLTVYFGSGPGNTTIQFVYPELSGSTSATQFRFSHIDWYNSSGVIQGGTNVTVTNASGTVTAQKSGLTSASTVLTLSLTF